MTLSLKTLTFSAAWIALGLLQGCASAPEQISESEAHDAPIAISKAEWLGQLPDKLTSALCAEDEIFRTCFDVTQTECQTHARAAASRCGDQFNQSIPDVVNGPMGERWGGEIGKCAGQNLYEDIGSGYLPTEDASCELSRDAG